MVFEAPVIVITPVELCVKAPDPDVEILPATFNKEPAAAEIPDLEKLMLLKLCVPAPLIMRPGPSKFTVPVLPVNVPALDQLPLAVSVLLPPLNVVDEPIVVLPLIVISAAAA